MRDRDTYGAAFFLGLAVVIGVHAIHFPIGQLKRVGPGFFPLVLAISLGILSLVLLCRSLRYNKEAVQVRWPSRWHGLILTVVSLFAYSLIVQPVGFLLTTFIFTLTLFKYAYARRWILPLLGALMATVLSVFIFKIFLGIPLPSGIFGY